MILALLLALLPGCAPAECLEECTEWGQFVSACSAADGTLCDGTVTADCIDDPQAILACEDANWEGDECEYDALVESGVMHACTTGPEAAASCRGMTRAHYGALEGKSEQEEFAAQCFEEDDEFEAAIRAEDCDTICEMFGA